MSQIEKCINRKGPEMKRIIGIATGVFLVVGCATVAVTGRSQLSLITDEQIVSAANENYLKLMGSYTARNVVLRSGESATADETLQLVQSRPRKFRQ
jgi:hypothetical protein